MPSNTSATRYNMHNGHGSSNKTCCEYKANPIMATHATNPMRFRSRLFGIVIQCRLHSASFFPSVEFKFQVDLNAPVVVFNTLKTVHIVYVECSTHKNFIG